eukprot:SAG31_NODE_2838_length_5017_cov_3.102074_1_plen_246_part_00
MGGRGGVRLGPTLNMIVRATTHELKFVSSMILATLSVAALLVCTPATARAVDQQGQCAAVPKELRVSCVDSKTAIGPVQCAARGCCFDSAVDHPPGIATAQPGCLGGTLSTPKGGVHTLSWTHHVQFDNPRGFRVETEIAGYVHGGQRRIGAGPCCGNVFNVTATSVNNVGFDIKVARYCGPMPCTGKFVGFGQQLLLSWKAAGKTSGNGTTDPLSRCPFPLPPGPTPLPPPPPSVRPANTQHSC